MLMDPHVLMAMLVLVDIIQHIDYMLIMVEHGLTNNQVVEVVVWVQEQ
jgi:hypothetical protein